MSFWDFFLLMIWSYVFIAYLILLFHIVKDVFRDPDLGGGAKALWIIGLIVVPFLIALIYVITRVAEWPNVAPPRIARPKPKPISTSSRWRARPARRSRSRRPRSCWTAARSHRPSSIS